MQHLLPEGPLTIKSSGTEWCHKELRAKFQPATDSAPSWILVSQPAIQKPQPLKPYAASSKTTLIYTCMCTCLFQVCNGLAHVTVCTLPLLHKASASKTVMQDQPYSSKSQVHPWTQKEQNRWRRFLGPHAGTPAELLSSGLTVCNTRSLNSPLGL